MKPALRHPSHLPARSTRFVAVASSLTSSAIAALIAFSSACGGPAGDPFDPTLHEALMSQPSTDVTEPTVLHVAQPGHRVGDRVVRPARVIVAQPEDN